MINLEKIAEKIGTKNTTSRGILSAAKKLKRQRPNRKHLTDRPTRISASKWKKTVEIRKADPEAKAARDGFRRRQYVSSLRRKETSLLRIEQGLDGILSAIERQDDLNKALSEVARLREIVTGKKSAALKVDLSAAIIIPDFTAAMAERHGCKIRKTGKDWALLASVEPSCLVHTPGETEWRGGKPKYYTRAKTDNYVRSFSVIIDKQVVHGIFHDTKYQLTLPGGYVWGRDENGLKAIEESHPDRYYYPEVGDLLDGPCSILKSLAAK